MKRDLFTNKASRKGKAIADRFAEAGADLIIVDIDDKNLVKTTDELKVLGVNVTESLISPEDSQKTSATKGSRSTL